MHVGGLQLFAKPEGAGRGYVRELYGVDVDVLFNEHARHLTVVAPRRPQ